MKRLFTLQKRAIRYMSYASSNPCATVYIKDTCKPLFKKLSIMTAPCLYIYSVILFTTNNSNMTKMNETVHEHNTRIKKDIRINDENKTRAQRSPLDWGSRFYNVLPKAIKEKKGTSGFKICLKEYLIEHCFYSVKDFLIFKVASS